MKKLRTYLINEIYTLKISPAQKDILKFLVNTMDMTRRYTAELEHIAKNNNRKAPAARKTLHGLKELGLIEIIDKSDRFNKRLANEYIVLFDPENHSHDHLKEQPKKKPVNDILDDKTQKSLVLKYLVACAKGSAKCSPSINQICEHTKLRRSKVQAIIKCFEENEKVIKRIPRVSKNGIPMSNIYILLGNSSNQDLYKNIASDEETTDENPRDKSVKNPVVITENLTVRETVVLAYLRNMAKIKNYVIPSIRLIAEKCRLTMAIVRKVISSMVEKGILERRSRHTDKGSRTSNEYVIKAKILTADEKSKSIDSSAECKCENLFETLRNLTLNESTFMAAFEDEIESPTTAMGELNDNKLEKNLTRNERRVLKQWSAMKEKSVLSAMHFMSMLAKRTRLHSKIVQKAFKHLVNLGLAMDFGSESPWQNTTRMG